MNRFSATKVPAPQEILVQECGFGRHCLVRYDYGCLSIIVAIGLLENGNFVPLSVRYDGGVCDDTYASNDAHIESAILNVQARLK